MGISHMRHACRSGTKLIVLILLLICSMCMRGSINLLNLHMNCCNNMSSHWLMGACQSTAICFTICMWDSINIHTIYFMTLVTCKQLPLAMLAGKWKLLAISTIEMICCLIRNWNNWKPSCQMNWSGQLAHWVGFSPARSVPASNPST